MLKDKVAVVTGAGRGIGRAIAKTFAGYGAKVVVNYNGSEERANSLVAEIKEAGGEDRYCIWPGCCVACWACGTGL